MGTITGVLYGYLPFQGEMEIMTDESSVVQNFNASGKVWAAMLDRPDCYVYLIGRRVIANADTWGMIVGLRAALSP